MFATTHPTIEDDPIVTVWRTTIVGVGQWIDSTRDAYGSRGTWSGSADFCNRLSTAPPANAMYGPFDFWCVTTGPDALRAQSWDQGPAWFVDRPPLPACGYEFVHSDVNIDARRCLHDAVTAQDPLSA